MCRRRAWQSAAPGPLRTLRRRPAQERTSSPARSGHSGRVGMAQRMTRNGAPTAATMRQGRWATTRMVARYTRNEPAAEALRYL